jgi:Xaa-Pro aminopeptidase
MTRPERARVRRLRQLMRTAGIPALLVTRREDVRYLSAFTGSSGSLLVGVGRTFLITDFRYRLQANKETSGVTVLILKKDYYATLREAVLRGAGAPAICVDASSVTIAELNKIRKQGLTVKARPDMVGELRMRKDAQELKYIRNAIRTAEQAFLELRPHIKPGAEERALGSRLEWLMRENGARRAAFETIVASGPNGAMPHAGVTNRRIRKGDLVTLDFGAEADGYCSDITRTVCAGRPVARQRELHALVMQAQETALRAVKPGIACKAVDAAARGVIRDAGYGKCFGHGTGHGVGLAVHEAPSVSAMSKDEVARDMVFTIEPGVYIPGWGGIRIEDMVLAEDDGPRALTTLPKEL